MNNPLQTLLEQNKIMISDGAMATELEKRGVATNNELWSAMALVTDQEAIQAVHASYFEQGAHIATTNTYQANIPAFEKFGLNETKSIELVVQAVELAQAAKTTGNQLIAGSVGPYGAYLADGSEYTGAYELTQAEYQDFHRPRMQAMVDAGVDFFALETMPNFEECKALNDLIEHEFSTMSAWMSWSVTDSGDQLWDGTSLIDATQWADKQDHLVAMGVNCTKMENILNAIKIMHNHTDKPIVAYPNNGDLYDPVSKTWQKVENAPEFTNLVSEWIDNGAKIIGGCCRTTPDDILEIKQSVDEYLNQH